MKKLLFLLLVPLIAGCELVNQFLPSDKPNQLTVEVSSPTFQYRAVNDENWTTVASVALSGEVSTRNRISGKVINSATFNPGNAVTTIQTADGDQEVYVNLRAQNLIAEGKEQLVSPQTSNTKVTLYPLISRVVVPPMALNVGANAVQFWVLGPLFRIAPNAKFYSTEVRVVSGNATVGTNDESKFALNVAAGESGKSVTLEVQVKGTGTQSLTTVSSTVTLTVQ
jgi:hypothetical protein